MKEKCLICQKKVDTKDDKCDYWEVKDAAGNAHQIHRKCGEERGMKWAK